MREEKTGKLGEDGELRLRRIEREKKKIAREYRRLAFDGGEEVKVSERLRALSEYERALSGEEDDGGVTIVVNYDYK